MLHINNHKPHSLRTESAYLDILTCMTKHASRHLAVFIDKDGYHLQ